MAHSVCGLAYTSAGSDPAPGSHAVLLLLVSDKWSPLGSADHGPATPGTSSPWACRRSSPQSAPLVTPTRCLAWQIVTVIVTLILVPRHWRLAAFTVVDHRRIPLW